MFGPVAADLQVCRRKNPADLEVRRHGTKHRFSKSDGEHAAKCQWIGVVAQERMVLGSNRS